MAEGIGSTLQNFWKGIWDYCNNYIFFPVKQLFEGGFWSALPGIVDIFLLSLILYYVYKFVRNRRAGKLAIGIILLMGLYLLSDGLNMLATFTILKNFFTVGILAVVVIFQPELRDALEKVGTTSMKFRDFRKKKGSAVELSHMVNSIAEAAVTLSKEGYGALIVIERTTMLGDYINKGVKIDAVVSQQLLANIFVNKSPLHDGAVIIHGNRIAAAGCKFPLSDNEELLRGLGTRHRAAVGISEVSDAVVVIVSEETGTISIANNKLLRRNYSQESLQQDLFKLLTGQDFSELAAESALPTGSAEQSGEKIDEEETV